MTDHPPPPSTASDGPAAVTPASTVAKRDIRRTWTRRGVHVATVHPQYGELPRGRIQIAPGGWTWTDPDGNHGRVTGDYLDAETTLLDATAALDLLDPDYPTAADLADQAEQEQARADRPTTPQLDPRRLADQASTRPAASAASSHHAAPTATAAHTAAGGPHPGRAR